ncbi:anti-sigma factor [Microbacterium paraoxydans]|uniref:Regulator of SigK n=1 Tax=Microbacterium paraoxydans TaxID=199592 RepID=A0ABS5IN79_9MICO|nr:anti-sigma factor [Microbacterium paraoxydans]MBS0024391.1 anti-sigma factor [Microbacterium paraoxydans]
MNEKDFAELAAGAALHALSTDDEKRYRRALAEHPEWAAVADIEADSAALLGEGVTPVAPSPGIRAALLAQIAHTPQGGGDDRDAGVHQSPEAEAAAPSAPEAPGVPETRAPRRWTRLAFALAACLALLVGVGVGAVALNAQLTRPASVVALQEIEAAGDAQQATVELDGGATATAHWSGSVGKAVLVTDGLPETDAGKTYELWFVRGEEPIAAGVFDPEDGAATALLEGEMRAGDAIAVTVEQEGGSPTGQPTTDPVIVIPTA